MQKTSAINFFGGVAETACAIGISSQAVSDWPDVLPPRIADRVIAAAVRVGREVPPEFLEKPLEHDGSGQKAAA